jgi:uncharacterized protein YkwD
VCLVAALVGGTAYLVLGRSSSGPDEAPPPQQKTGPTRPIAAKNDPSKTDSNPKPPPVKETEEQALVRGALEAINARRSEARVAAVALDAERGRGCFEHARYLAANLAERPDLDPHEQDASLSGASAAGRAVAAVASVFHGDPVTAVKAWLEAPAHRDLLLGPDLKTIGVGLVRKDKGWLCVFDLLGGARPPSDGDHGGVFYPAHRQTEVPLLFPGNEVPDPVPLAQDKLAGFPITMKFPVGVRVVGASAHLEDEAGRDVPLWFSSPEKPANSEQARLQQNTLCLIARRPLLPGTRYLVRVQARVDGAKWSRTWSFATLGQERIVPAMCRRALGRFNLVRKAAGQKPVRIDPKLSKACTAHAAYLARHLDNTPGLPVNDERKDLPGYTPEGQAAARQAAIRLGGGGSAVDAVDWMLESVRNRPLVLNPSTQTIGVGAAFRAPRGWVWVVALSPNWRSQPGNPATLYPGKNQRDVALHLGLPVSDMVKDVPKDHAAGFAVTANFFPTSKLRNVSARLKVGGQEVECWLSSPEKPLPGTGGNTYAHIVLIPKKPLAPATTYTASFSAVVDDKDWAETWSFTTIDTARYRNQVAAALRDQINQVRKHAGLGPVTLDEKLAVGAQAHARYVVRNLDHPKLGGLGIHEEDPSLPEATPEGARAGKVAVIARISDPVDSVDGWMATLYHRLPLLDPALKRIGYGQEQHPFSGWITVMDISGR